MSELCREQAAGASLQGREKFPLRSGRRRVGRRIRYRTQSWQKCKLGGTAKSFVPWDESFFFAAGKF